MRGCFPENRRGRLFGQEHPQDDSTGPRVAAEIHARRAVSGGDFGRPLQTSNGQSNSKRHGSHGCGPQGTCALVSSIDVRRFTAAGSRRPGTMKSRGVARTAAAPNKSGCVPPNRTLNRVAVGCGLATARHAMRMPDATARPHGRLRCRLTGDGASDQSCLIPVNTVRHIYTIHRNS